MARRRLKTMEDVRRYLANLINRTEHDEIDPAVAGKLGYLASILTRVIEGSDLEKRVVELEKSVKTQGEKHREKIYNISG